jgi:uncharacterized protein (TIGR03437 family)
MIGGQSAFIDYVSPGQVNAQVPSTVANGPQSVVVMTPSGTTSASTIFVNSTEPGLLAPTLFSIGGNQYVGALLPNGTTYILPPGAVAGITSQAAQPDQMIVLYGVGFGSVTPSIPAGQIVSQENQLVLPLVIWTRRILRVAARHATPRQIAARSVSEQTKEYTSRPKGAP